MNGACIHSQVVIYLAAEQPSQSFMNFIDDQEITFIHLDEGSKPALTTKPISEVPPNTGPCMEGSRGEQPPTTVVCVRAWVG